MLGTNRDETMFVWFQSKSNDVFKLTDETLKARLRRELGADADTVITTYRKSRPNASSGDLYTAITTACMFWFPSIRIAERKALQRGAAVYMYLFAHESNFIIPGTNRTIGAPHAVEIPYKFDNIHPVGEERHGDSQLSFGNDVMDAMVGSDPDRQRVAQNMSQLWTTFARTGQPKAKGQPAWPAYTTETRATMQIDAECKIVYDPFGQERIMFEHLISN
jgi:para-nitrobenzyl esterase